MFLFRACINDEKENINVALNAFGENYLFRRKCNKFKIVVHLRSEAQRTKTSFIFFHLLQAQGDYSGLGQLSGTVNSWPL